MKYNQREMGQRANGEGNDPMRKDYLQLQNWRGNVHLSFTSDA